MSVSVVILVEHLLIVQLVFFSLILLTFVYFCNCSCFLFCVMRLLAELYLYLFMFVVLMLLLRLPRRCNANRHVGNTHYYTES